MSKNAKPLAIEDVTFPPIGTVEAWRKFLVTLGVPLAEIDRQLAAYAAVHPEGGQLVEFARRLLAESMGSDSLNTIASAASVALVSAIQSGHGEVDKKVHPTDFA